jgi:hypothetical protein
MTTLTKVNDSTDYIDYEIAFDLAPYDDKAADSVANEHSLIVRLSYDHLDRVAFGVVVYEVNGNSSELGALSLTVEDFGRITGHFATSEGKLSTLRRINGQVTIKDGIATLEDGSTITL